MLSLKKWRSLIETIPQKIIKFSVEHRSDIFGFTNIDVVVRHGVELSDSGIRTMLRNKLNVHSKMTCGKCLTKANDTSLELVDKFLEIIIQMVKIGMIHLELLNFDAWKNDIFQNRVHPGYFTSRMWSRVKYHTLCVCSHRLKPLIRLSQEQHFLDDESSHAVTHKDYRS